VACGDYVAQRFTETTCLKCIPIKNILEIKKPVSKIYKFIYAGRLYDVDKNANLIRLKKFIQMLETADIKYLLWIYTTGTCADFNDNENIIIRKARYYNLRDEISDADYGLLFSDFEGLPCFVQECLQYGTPCIVTANGGCMELIKNSVNGYVVPFDMEFDINIIKKIPKIKNYQNGTSADTWCNLLGGAKHFYKKRVPTTQKIIALLDYFDTVEQMQIKKGDVYEVTFDRAEEIISKNLAIKGVNL
jgi:glycosyltransferase involved in cell wall biosynthesis